ncbi:MAG: cellulose-binding protein [Spirulinaceae cyanobacterium]
MTLSTFVHRFFRYIALFCITSSLLITWGCISSSNSQTLPNYNSPMGGNLDFPGDWSEEYPFIDWLKNSRNWVATCPDSNNACFPNNEKPQDNGISSIQMDDQGWVTTLQTKHDPSKSFANVETIFLSLDEEHPLPEKRFYVFYEGEGTLDYTLSAQKNEELSQPGRDVVDITKDKGYAVIKIRETDPQNTGNYLRNIRIIRADHLDEYEAGETLFNPDFLKHIENYKALRFMDWMLTNSSDEKEWRDRPKPDNQISYVSHYIQGKGKVRGYPIEIMTELANRVQAYPWFNIPHQATDEYIREFAQLVKAELDPELKVYVEYSNEVWNWGFPQSQYALQQARDRWGKDEKGEYYSDGWMQYHGMRTAQICDTWKQELGSDRVVCVLGVQTGWQGLESSALDCPLYVAEGNNPCWQSGIDALGVTGYFSGYLQKDDNIELIQTWLDNGDRDYAFDQAFQQLEFGNVEGVEGGSREFQHSLATAKESFKYFQDVAKAKNLDVVWYEGGTHFDSSGNDRIDRFLKDIAQHEKMYDLYMKLFDSWKQAGGQLIVMWGGIAADSAWSFKHSLDDTDHPKWRAMMDFIEQNPCWWDGCRPGES